MADEYAALTIDTEALRGIKDDALQMLNDDIWALAKRRLRARLRGVIDAYIQYHDVGETEFFDLLAALASGDVYDELRTMIAYEALVVYYGQRVGASGIGASPQMRVDKFEKDLQLHVDGFGRMIDWAVANESLTLPDDRSQTGGATLWLYAGMPAGGEGL